MALREMRRGISVLAAVALAGMSGAAGAQTGAPPSQLNTPHIERNLLPAGLWDKPNEACMNKCQTFVQKDCFKRLAEKSPTADPGTLQDKCDDNFSICLYDCMCETCDENQIIIKQQ